MDRAVSAACPQTDWRGSQVAGLGEEFGTPHMTARPGDEWGCTPSWVFVHQVCPHILTCAPGQSPPVAPQGPLLPPKSLSKVMQSHAIFAIMANCRSHLYGMLENPCSKSVVAGSFPENPFACSQTPKSYSEN